MRVLEFYSGIGGMHAALDLAKLSFDVARAYDINDLANRVYNHIYNCSAASNRAIESISYEECLKHSAELWTMSPPCQPFTRMGNQKHGDDARSSSLASIIVLIQKVKPKVIFLENVKGFEGSEPWQLYVKALLDCGYDIRHFLLTPLQFGIPNCRLRYYLVAKLPDEPENSAFNFGVRLTDTKDFETTLIRFPPSDQEKVPDCLCAYCQGQTKHITSFENHYEEYLPFCRPLSDYLLPENEVTKGLCLSEKELGKYYRILDIVTPESRKSACFTKGYAQRFEGTGSYLRLSQEKDSEKFITVRPFHSKEIARLLCFPEDMEFPQDVSEKQRKRLLGNSINVMVVAHIMRWALSVAD